MSEAPALPSAALPATGAPATVAPSSVVPSTAPPVPRPHPGARLVARGLSGADRAGLRGAARGSILGVELALGRGVHVVLGRPEDGTIALGELVAGRCAPARGTVFVDGGEPWRTPAVRRRIAHLAEIPELPEARSVSGSVRAALRARGGPGEEAEAARALGAIGCAALAGRTLASLTHGEARAVDLALALALERPAVAILHEPFADVTGADAVAIERRLRSLADEGTCVLVLTSSPRDAARLGDDILILERGQIDRGAVAGGEGLLTPAPWPGARPRRFELVAHLAHPAGAPGDAPRGNARDVARHLLERSALTSVTWEEPRPGTNEPAWLRVAGPDEAACALALAEAIDAVGAELIALAPVPTTLFEVHTATEELRVAARWFARAHAIPPPSALPHPTSLDHAPPAPSVPVEAPLAETISGADAPSPSADAPSLAAGALPSHVDAPSPSAEAPSSAPPDEPEATS